MRQETQKHRSQWMKQRNEGREMPGEASHFAVVLERIARNALAQFRDMSDVDINSPLELPESNTAFVLATHLIGSAEYWVLELAGGRDVQRDRPSEFQYPVRSEEHTSELQSRLHLVCRLLLE